MKNWIHRELLWSMKLKSNPSPNIGRMTVLTLTSLFPWQRGNTADGSEIRLSPVEVGSLSGYLRGFIHPRWLFGISEPSTVRLQRHMHLPTKKKTGAPKKAFFFNSSVRSITMRPQHMQGTFCLPPPKKRGSRVIEPTKKMWDQILDLLPSPRMPVSGKLIRISRS